MADEGNGNRDANVKETVRFWRAWKTVHQLCKDRVRDTDHPSDMLRFNVQFLPWPQNRRNRLEWIYCDNRMLIAMASRDTSCLTRR